MANRNVGGVQGWSQGDIYPYTIVVVGGAINRGVIYAQGPAGKLREHPFYKGDTRANFRSAHKIAESDARWALFEERRREAA